MKQEDKDLLLKDLCARLPYEPIVEYVIKGPGGSVNITSKLDTLHIEELLQNSEDLVEVKPYLRPMSSMTEEERKIQKGYIYHFSKNSLPDYEGDFVFEDEAHEYIDWLNKKMFDFRGLIPKDLALSTDEFNPYKE